MISRLCGTSRNLFYIKYLDVGLPQGVRRARGTQGFQILVQGDRHPAYVETRIDNFLNDLGVSVTLDSCCESFFPDNF